MKINMSYSDRIIRILLALAIGISYYASLISGTLAVVLLILGGILALTSIIGFCPMYSLLGLTSMKLQKKQ